MAEDSKVKQILEMKVQGRRGKGRPRIMLRREWKGLGDKGTRGWEK